METQVPSAFIEHCFSDAFQIRAGMRPALPHPHAEQLANDGPLSALAMMYGERLTAASGADPHPGAVFARGLSSSDFKSTLSDVLRIVTFQGYEQTADHLALCQTVEVPNLKSTLFPTADIPLDLELGGEFSEATAVAITSVSGLEGRLQTFRRRLDVSRQVFKNDDVNLLKRIATELGFAASRVESNLATMLLESNPTMGDGLPMFGDSNIIAAALSGTSFDAALKLLRLQLTPAGNVANNRAAVLAVSAGLELTARSFLHLAGFDEVRVVVLPALPDGRWYVLASPLLSPAIGRLALSGPHAATTAPITIGPARTPAAFDGLSFKAISDLGTVALNRVGCVKGGA